MHFGIFWIIEYLASADEVEYLIGYLIHMYNKIIIIIIHVFMINVGLYVI